MKYYTHSEPYYNKKDWNNAAIALADTIQRYTLFVKKTFKISTRETQAHPSSRGGTGIRILKR